MRVGRVEEAGNMFCRIQEKDVACRNAMISGYCSNGSVHKTYALFEGMPNVGCRHNDAHIKHLGMCSDGTCQ
uniref:Pentatricopeptide repeat-containing protein n=1 Tax=Leersia perrieri TaxID=77586 RepID=A0A0D9UYZ0_9ORYZ